MVSNKQPSVNVMKYAFPPYFSAFLLPFQMNIPAPRTRVYMQTGSKEDVLEHWFCRSAYCVQVTTLVLAVHPVRSVPVFQACL